MESFKQNNNIYGLPFERKILAANLRNDSNEANGNLIDECGSLWLGQQWFMEEWAWVVLKNIIFMTLFKNSTAEFFRGALPWALAVGVIDWAQFWIKQGKQGKVGIYRQGAGWGLVDRKLLRWNIKGNGGFWLNQPNRILAEVG